MPIVNASSGSRAVTVTTYGSLSRASSIRGVPEITPVTALIVAEYVRVSPSASEKFPETLRLNGEFSIAVWSAIGVSSTGSSFTAVTAIGIENSWLASPPGSATVAGTLISPLKFSAGVTMEPETV